MDNIGIFTFFTGAGFLDLGFEKAGFRSLFSNELIPEFCRAYKYSRSKLNLPLPQYGLREVDVEYYCDAPDDPDDKESLIANEERIYEKQYLTNSVKEAKQNFDLIGFIGGPPCPDFSVAGKNRGARGRHGRLSQIYMDIICREKPDFFVFENVKGLWRTAVHRAFFDDLVKQAHNAGYFTTARLINALEYGAPQDRDRIILIGIQRNKLKNAAAYKNAEITDFPWQKHILYPLAEVKQKPWPKTNIFSEGSILPVPPDIIQELTVEHWFRKNDVERHPNGNDFFVPRAGLVKMQTYDEGDDSKKCYKRLHRWRYSPTAAYGNNEVHLHPYKARRLSVAEALAIQSLPKEFELPPDISLSAKFKTIGNGVPFVAAFGVAKTLKDFLKTRTEI